MPISYLIQKFVFYIFYKCNRRNSILPFDLLMTLKSHFQIGLILSLNCFTNICEHIKFNCCKITHLVYCKLCYYSELYGFICIGNQFEINAKKSYQNQSSSHNSVTAVFDSHSFYCYITKKENANVEGCHCALYCSYCK